MDKVSDTPNQDEVICPACSHQFRAIPENVQSELAAQKEQFRVLEDEMLVMMDERNEAEKALRVAVGLLSTMPKYSSEHPDYTLEYILNIAREMK